MLSIAILVCSDLETRKGSTPASSYTFLVFLCKIQSEFCVKSDPQLLKKCLLNARYSYHQLKTDNCHETRRNISDLPFLKSISDFIFGVLASTS